MDRNGPIAQYKPAWSAGKSETTVEEVNPAYGDWTSNALPLGNAETGTKQALTGPPKANIKGFKVIFAK